MSLDKLSNYILPGQNQSNLNFGVICTLYDIYIRIINLSDMFSAQPHQVLLALIKTSIGISFHRPTQFLLVLASET